MAQHFSFSGIVNQYDKSDIMNYVQCYEVTEWYHPEMIRANLNPSDIFTAEHMLADLTKMFEKLQQQDNPQHDTITLVEGGACE